MPSKRTSHQHKASCLMQESQQVCARTMIIHCGTPTHFTFDMLNQNLMQTVTQACRYLTLWERHVFNECMYVWMNVCMYGWMTDVHHVCRHTACEGRQPLIAWSLLPECHGAQPRAKEADRGLLHVSASRTGLFPEVWEQGAERQSWVSVSVGQQMCASEPTARWDNVMMTIKSNSDDDAIF